MDNQVENSNCQACRNRLATTDVESEEARQPYRLCSPCAHRLEALALRPLEWFNLAAIHSPWKFLLHDDFYDDIGVAEQSKEPVETPEIFPAPTLEEVAADHERLIDYAMTLHYFLDQRAAVIVHALQQHDKAAILTSLQARLLVNANPYIVGRAYEICARVVGPLAEAWIRTQWSLWLAGTEEPHDGPLSDLAQASAACLPEDEGITYVITALDALPHKKRIEACQALDWFQSSLALDWIEVHADEIGTWISPHWGYLAATSHLTWDRVVRWLEAGRPLSLVSLDALKACGRHDTIISKYLAPRLHDPASQDIMTQILQSYAVRDAVPRVERDVNWIISNWEAIDREE